MRQNVCRIRLCLPVPIGVQSGSAFSFGSCLAMLVRAIPLLLIANLLACPLVCAAADCCSLRSNADNTTSSTASCCTAKTSCLPASYGDLTVPGPAHPLPGGHECQCLCQAEFWAVSSAISLPERCQPALQRSVDLCMWRVRMLSTINTAGRDYGEPQPVTGRLMRCLFNSLLC